jgi:N-acetylglucosamine kinase-like BadF-type ATPase
VGPGIPVDVTHDAQAALYAGNPAGRGVVLIAGTGSVAYGRNASGEEERSGGWGHLIGDEGSAFWIGKEGLQAASHDYDGRGGPTAISRHLYRDLGVDDLQGVLPLLYGRPHPAPAIAAATRAVAQANSEGDAIAADIVERGARELARAATVVAMKLGLADGPVYLAGGAFENVPALEQRVRQELLSALPRAAVGPVAEEPAMGAARLAATLAWGAR